MDPGSLRTKMPLLAVRADGSRGDPGWIRAPYAQKYHCSPCGRMDPGGIQDGSAILTHKNTIARRAGGWFQEVSLECMKHK